MPKVSIVRCKDYNSERVFEAVSHAVGLLGGIESFIKQNDTVLIKPNLLSARDPEEAVTTHPEVVRAAIRLAKEAGARVLVGDSPGTFFTSREVEPVYEKTGIKRIAEEEKAELVRLDKSRIINGYPIAEIALNASSIISLPKLKTHALTVMTGAIKNTFGLVPGYFKVECHRNKPKPKDFATVLLDVYEIIKPHLFIMDGIVAMEGDGPAAGSLREAGLILASSDAVSLDVVMSKLVNLPSHQDIVIKEARRRKVGETDIHKIEVVGEAIEDVSMRDFKLPKTSHRTEMLPDFLVYLLTRLIGFRPVIDEKLCKKCEICKRSCPVYAITIDEDASRIDKKICIRCFCCSEVCLYKAIFIKKNFFARLLWQH